VRVSVVGLPRAFPHADTTSAFGGSYLGQLALLSQLGDLAHDRRRMQADRRESEQRVVDLVDLRLVSPGVLDAPPAAEAAALPLTALNTMVRIHVESVGLDDAGSRRRLNKQPDYHHHFAAAARSRTPAIQDRCDRAGRPNGFDAHRRSRNAGISKLDAIERAGIMEELSKVASEVCS
jgi:hypothetical protein